MSDSRLGAKQTRFVCLSAFLPIALAIDSPRTSKNVAPAERSRRINERVLIRRKGQKRVRQGARARHARVAERDALARGNPIRLFIGAALTKIVTNCRLSSEFIYILALAWHTRAPSIWFSLSRATLADALYIFVLPSISLSLSLSLSLPPPFPARRGRAAAL